MNISAQKRGMDFMLGSKNGLAYANQTLKKFVTLPMPAGFDSPLKRLCLMFLYNFSICEAGAIFLQQSDCGVKNILSCLGPENPPEIQQVALNLIISLLDEISTMEFRHQVSQLVCESIFILNFVNIKLKFFRRLPPDTFDI